MTDAEKLRQAIEEDVYVGDLADLGPILVAEIKRLRWKVGYYTALLQTSDDRRCCRCYAVLPPAGHPLAAPEGRLCPACFYANPDIGPADSGRTSGRSAASA
jgi:hypothetical protein